MATQDNIFSETFELLGTCVSQYGEQGGGNCLFNAGFAYYESDRELCQTITVDSVIRNLRVCFGDCSMTARSSAYRGRYPCSLCTDCRIYEYRLGYGFK